MHLQPNNVLFVIVAGLRRYCLGHLRLTPWDFLGDQQSKPPGWGDRSIDMLQHTNRINPWVVFSKLTLSKIWRDFNLDFTGFYSRNFIWFDFASHRNPSTRVSTLLFRGSWTQRKAPEQHHRWPIRWASARALPADCFGTAVEVLPWLAGPGANSPEPTTSASAMGWA